MLRRLRIKFICINMTIVTVMLCVMFGLVFHITRQNLEMQSLQMMHTIAAEPFRPGRPNERPEQVRLPYFTLEFGPHGELIADGGGYYDLSDEEFLQELTHAVNASGGQTGVLSEYNLRFCRVQTPKTQRLVFADMSSEQAILTDLVQTFLFIGALSLLVFFVVSLFLARWAVKPVDQAWNQQRQFVADASHELKTPLTVILTNAELLQDPDCDEKSKAQSAASILTMSHQMRGLVESLLELARVDNGMIQKAMTRVEFSQLCSDAILPFEPLFFEKGLGLESQIEPGLRLTGSEAHLRQVLDILLDNAMKYSAPQGTVHVLLRRQGSHCALSVSNPGDPIPPQDLKNIFKRFYRADRARSMNHSYGLGLSIAEHIVQEHRGKIWAESAGGRNTFYVHLPLS